MHGGKGRPSRRDQRRRFRLGGELLPRVAECKYCRVWLSGAAGWGLQVAYMRTKGVWQTHGCLG